MVTPTKKTDSKPAVRVPQFRSFVDRSDFEAIAPVFENNYIAEGPFARQFQAQLLDIIGAPHGVFACNGTLAIYLALKALGIGAGDDVLVQNMTFIASANAVEMVGANPIFVDTPAFNDFTIDLNRVEITSNTKAMVIAHLFGSACTNIEEIQAFCRDNDLLLIEDASQALAISNSDNHCGTFGDVGTFSFYADKTITTAEGGFVVTPNENVLEKMMYLRNQGRKQSGTFVHPEIGYNFRITDLQAALGLSQLKKLETIKQEKAWIYERYRHYLGDRVEYLKLHDDFNHIPFRVVVFVDDAKGTMEAMQAQGIEPRSVFYPLHSQPCYQQLNFDSQEFPHSNEGFARGICLPTWVGLTEEQIRYTADALIGSLS